MKNMPDTFSIDFACLQISPFETVILYSFWDIPQIKTVKPPDKRPSISDRYSFLCRRSVKFQFIYKLGETVLQHSPGRAASKACWLMWFIRKMPKFLFAQDVPYAIMKVYVL